jgi:hypothetical protein
VLKISHAEQKEKAEGKVRAVGLLRFIVVFLVGLGVALGAYATGTLDYMAHSRYLASWYPWPHHSMMLRVAEDAPGACATRYAIDNRSGRRVLVVFAPPANAPLLNAQAQPPGAYGYEGPERPRDVSASGNDDAYGPPDGPVEMGPHEPDVAADDPYTNGMDSAPFAVEPGETKLVGPAYGAQPVAGRYDPNGEMAGERCGAGHVVTLQITDCATDRGACVLATSPSGEAPQFNQGEE